MIHIIRHKDYDFPIPSGYVTCEVGPLFKGDRPNINELNPIINELTGIYDVWQNFDDPFVGFTTITDSLRRMKRKYPIQT